VRGVRGMRDGVAHEVGTAALGAPQEARQQLAWWSSSSGKDKPRGSPPHSQESACSYRQ